MSNNKTNPKDNSNMKYSIVNPEKPYHREFVYNLPETIFFDTDLTINDLRVYGVIRSFMDTRGDAYPSNNWIARRLNIHRTTAITCINRLIKKDYILKEDIKGHRHLRIKTHPIPQEIIAPIDSDLAITPLVAPALPPSSGRTTPPSSASATQLDQTLIRSKNINNNNAKRTKKSGSVKPVITEKFDGELLELREKHLPGDESDRTDGEFLKQCSHFLDNADRDKYPLAARMKALKTIIKNGFFEKPKGYDEKKVVKSLHTPEESALLYKYEHALRMVALGEKIEVYMPDPQELKKAMALKEMLGNNKPSLSKRIGGIIGFGSK